MEATLKILNEVVRKGILKTYAIGGGVGAIFYMEPVLTYDLDVFVFLQKEPAGLVTLSPIYEYLRKKGCAVQQEHVLIAGVPVQLIPAYNDLVEEAVREARARRYRRTTTRVLRVEYLLAIMIQTGRPKDKVRVAQLLEEATVNRGYLEKVLARHGLREKWDEFTRGFYGTKGPSR